MPTIVALCPYCRVGGVRAPSTAVGAVARCPKCGSNFTVMPSEGAPGWAANAPGTASSATAAKQVATQQIGQTAPPSVAPPAVPATRPADETKPTAAIVDDTTPSSGVAGKKKSRKKPTTEAAVEDKEPVPAPVAEPATVPATAPTPAEETEEDPAEVTDFGLVAALSALALFGVAMLATLVPYGRFIAGGLAVLGFLGGLTSLGAEGRARIAGGVACGLHFLLLAVVILLPSWLGLDTWRDLVIPDKPPAPQAFSHDRDHQTNVAQWVDAASSSWQFKDVRVTVASIGVGPLELIGPNGVRKRTKDQYLLVGLHVQNIGVERGVELSGWAVGRNPETVQVTDSSGKALTTPAFEEGWFPDIPSGTVVNPLFPGKTSETWLLLTSPPPRIDFVRMVLPGTVFGFTEEVKFQIGSGSLFRSGPQLKK